MQVFAELEQSKSVSLPSFDKSRDDRRPREQWIVTRGTVDVLRFGGWCVGARAQSERALDLPVNALESDEDPDGIWRRYANSALAGPYQALFDRIHLLLLLNAPDFNAVYHWRREQEEKLRKRVAAEGGDTSRLMAPAQLRRFLGHYERLTTHILEEMPARADVVLPGRASQVNSRLG